MSPAFLDAELADRLQGAVIRLGLIDQRANGSVDIIHHRLFGLADRIGIGGSNDVGAHRCACHPLKSQNTIDRDSAANRVDTMVGGVGHEAHTVRLAITYCDAIDQATHLPNLHSK